MLAIDRSCTTASDCLTAMHSIHCCGPSQFIGFRSSEKTLFQTLEAQCDASLGICDCPRVPPIAEDGSWLRSNEVAAVACLQGRCTTFVADCGQPCPAGTTCFSCPGQGTLFAACTTPCTDSSMCTGSTLPLCQMGWSGNRVGQFCTAAGFQCDGR